MRRDVKNPENTSANRMEMRPTASATKTTLFFYVRTGRATDDDKCDPIRFTFPTFSFKFIYSLFFGVLLLVFLSLPHQLASIQHATPWCIYFYVRATFVLLFAYSFEECWCGGKNNKKNNNLKNVAKAYFKRYRITVIFPHFPFFFLSIIIILLPHFITSIDIDTCWVSPFVALRFFPSSV